MNASFDRLPIHRKLVVMAVVVSTIALAAATMGLVVIDLWRYRANTAEDTGALAQVIAENAAAAVLFADAEAASQTLGTLRVRPAVRRACVYLPEGPLFAQYTRTDDLTCDPRLSERSGWTVVSARSPVMRNQRIVGTVYVERELVEIRQRILLAASVGVTMLLLAGLLAYALAQRLHRTISSPIMQLAAAAKGIGPEEQQYDFPTIMAPADEIGQLVRSFTDMVARIQTTTERLRQSSAEREGLLARERDANRLKDEFLAAVSHELRTPLNAILGWTQVLNTTGENPQRTAKAIASIAKNASAQTRLIEDLVDVSRIVTGKLHVRWDPVDVRSPIESAQDVVRQLAQEKQISLSVHLPPEACLVNGDRDRLQQIAANLLSNAVKFTPRGGAVSVTLRGEEGFYILDVSDTGIGILPSFLPFVFERFRQADGSTTREYGGLGLGLAIVKELTELHGGSVRAQSAGRDQGATFSVYLPQMKGLEDAPHASVGASGNHRSLRPLERVQVLVIDDNVDALEIASAALRDAGADVRTASSGGAALAAWDEQPADVLVCDLAMPHMDGFEVLAAIRARDAGATRPTPAIAVTAHASDRHHAQTQAAGFTSHLTKPYQIATLVDAIVTALNGRH